MVMMAMTAADRLGQILDIGDLAVGRSTLEVGRELAQPVRRCRIAFSLSRLGGVLQIRGDLLGDLPILTRIRLLELL